MRCDLVRVESGPQNRNDPPRFGQEAAADLFPMTDTSGYGFAGDGDGAGRDDFDRAQYGRLLAALAAVAGIGFGQGAEDSTFLRRRKSKEPLWHIFLPNMLFW